MTTPPINSFDASGANTSDDVIIGNQNLGPPGEAAAMLRRQIVVCSARIEAAKQRPAAVRELADAERWLVELTRDLAHVQSLIDSPPVSPPADAVDEDVDFVEMTEEERERELVRLANQGRAPGQVEVYGEPTPVAEEPRPLTSHDLHVIMGAFQKTVADALANQQQAFERKLAGGFVPAQGTLAPKNIGEADEYVVTGKKVDAGQVKEATVKSTVEIAGALRLRMKAFEIDNKLSAQKLIVAAIEEYLVKRGR